MSGARSTYPEPGHLAARMRGNARGSDVAGLAGDGDAEQQSAAGRGVLERDKERRRWTIVKS